jgi:lipopolysaccharide export LptBFGC system permease protein LptF
VEWWGKWRLPSWLRGAKFFPRRTKKGSPRTVSDSVKLLDRYIARQILVSALYAVAVIIIILVLGNVFKEILRELAKRPDISLLFVLKFILLVIPVSLSLAIPFSFLTAILLVFGRLSADSEFVSMRMAGLSMARICAPVAAVAVFFSAICAWVNLSVTPWAKTQMEGMKASLFNQMRKEPMMIFPDHQVMDDLPDHLVFARKEDGLLKGLQLVKMENYEPQAVVFAKEARVSVDFESENPEMVMDMKDVNVMAKGEEGVFMDSTQPIFMREAAFGVSIEEFKQRGETAMNKPDNLPPYRLYQRSRDRELDSVTRATCRTELSTRFAFSVSCLTFALIGVPLGVTAQRRESTAGFILALGIAVSYYTMLSFADMMKEREHLYPHLLVWVPNILFFGLGLHLFRKLSRK